MRSTQRQSRTPKTAGNSDANTTGAAAATDKPATDELAIEVEPGSERLVELLPLDHPLNCYLTAVSIAIMAADAYSHALFRAVNDKGAANDKAALTPTLAQAQVAVRPAQQPQAPQPPQALQTPQILPLCPDAPGGCERPRVVEG